MSRPTKYDALFQIGSQMSNLCFNLKQKAIIPEDIRRTMKELQEEWDRERWLLLRDKTDRGLETRDVRTASVNSKAKRKKR